MKDKRPLNIVLVGFMASGKTRVSQKLSFRLNKQRVSTDERIVQKQGCSIKEIFEQKGEKFFRDLEKETVQELGLLQNVIVDCGGGIFLNDDNISILKNTGIVFYLQATPETIFRRIQGQQDRPLLNVANPLATIKQLLIQRDPHYRQAHYIVDANQDQMEGVVDEIISLFSQNIS